MLVADACELGILPESRIDGSPLARLVRDSAWRSPPRIVVAPNVPQPPPHGRRECVMLIGSRARQTMSPSLLAATLAVAACAPPRAPVSDLASATRVVRFVPTKSPGEPRDGKCWTVSIAAPRVGAWRCMLGNEITDPCFVLPANGDLLVCGANPASGNPGFSLHLVEPMPADVVKPSAVAAPWLLRLANGQVCSPFTGTVPLVDGREARWSCADPSTGTHPGLITQLDEGTAWTAEWYPASEGRSPAHAAPSTVPPLRVAVTDVWE
jgi:hypothetical protein